ncbi:MAG: hypothetical protein RLY58_2314 [Pseudomonadota bacterium]
MDVPRLLAMNQYWASHPPLHMMIQGFLGIEPKPEVSAEAESSEDQDAQLEALMAQFG